MSYNNSRSPSGSGANVPGNGGGGFRLGSGPEPSSAANFAPWQLQILHAELDKHPRPRQRVPMDDIAFKTQLPVIQVILWFAWHRDAYKVATQSQGSTKAATPRAVALAPAPAPSVVPGPAYRVQGTSQRMMATAPVSAAAQIPPYHFQGMSQPMTPTAPASATVAGPAYDFHPMSQPSTMTGYSSALTPTAAVSPSRSISMPPPATPNKAKRPGSSSVSMSTPAPIQAQQRCSLPVSSPAPAPAVESVSEATRIKELAHALFLAVEDAENYKPEFPELTLDLD